MIQANEKLTPGNYLIYHGEEDMYCKLDAQDIFNIATGYMDNDKIHSPIPLTPEILEKCGFVNDKKNEWYQKFDLHFRIEYIEYLGEENFFLQGYRYSHRKIEYFHQLQNLYFALTGEELNIEL